MAYENIDWNSQTNAVLSNPRMPTHEKELLNKAFSILAPAEKGNLVLGTSGSTGALKYVVLSKEAVLTSAQAVNSHLHSGPSDCWLNPLPPFHVGGLGIIARGYLSGARVCPYEVQGSRWDVLKFIDQLATVKATLTALVPAQIFDLVSASLSPPPSLRAVIVGGGALAKELYFEAVAKGWPLLPSYGLTECASQVATAEVGSWDQEAYPVLKPLEHVQLALNDKGLLKIKSRALLKAYLSVEEGVGKLTDPKKDGWFTTEDFAQMDKGYLLEIYRRGAFLKIGGESVDMNRLELIFDEIKLMKKVSFDAVLISVPDERLGNAIHLAVCQKASTGVVDELLTLFHRRVFPFERVRKVHIVSKIPRSPLRKVLKHELLKDL